MVYAKKSMMRMVLSADLFVVVFFAVGGAVFTAASLFIFVQELRFRFDSAEVVGRVAKCWEGKADCNPDVVVDCETCDVGFAYEVHGKTNYFFGTTDFETYKGLENGALITVRYLRGNPSAAQTSFDRDTVEPSGGAGMAVWFGLMGGMYVLVSCGWLWSRFQRVRSSICLRDHGEERGAVVLEQEDVTEEGEWCIGWRDDSGVTGKSWGQARRRLPEAGARITVYADPAGKVPAVWEGDVGTR